MERAALRLLATLSENRLFVTTARRGATFFEGVFVVGIVLDHDPSCKSNTKYD